MERDFQKATGKNGTLSKIFTNEGLDIYKKHPKSYQQISICSKLNKTK